MNSSGHLFDAFRDPKLARGIVQKLRSKQPGELIKFMHVCGTHENSIARWGLRSLLPSWIKVIAGPGCPVCVCPVSDIQMAVDAALSKGVILATFGDMVRVPAQMSLQEAAGKGGDIRIVFGIDDAVRMATANPNKEVVFFAVGFETTAVTVAAAIHARPPNNFSIIVSHRLIPPALKLMCTLPDVNVAGFILPGHVSTVMGTVEYEVFPKRYQIAVAVAGFEPLDVLMGIKSLVEQVEQNNPTLENVYPRAVKREGNVVAKKILQEVFEPVQAHWRGIGAIPLSGLRLKDEYKKYDAINKLGLEHRTDLEELNPHCSCDKVMLGKIEPVQCKLFSKACTPENPYGPCMVSMEGTCRNWYKYGEVPISP